MWKIFSIESVRKNRTSGISVAAAALIASLFLSLICSLFYNIWIYDLEQIILEEGDWHGRICAELSEEDLSVIGQFANVGQVQINKALTEAVQAQQDIKLSESEMAVIDIRFGNMGAIYHDMPLICEKLGIGQAAVSYHETLLSRYLICDPQDETPPLLLPFFLIVLFLISVSLILIIHHSFAVSMNARMRQFGILSSVGASPRQITVCVMQEAVVLCTLPILTGSLLGIAGCVGIMTLVNRTAGDMAGRHEAVFQYHPLILAGTLLISGMTILVSAWIPAVKLRKVTPLQAIHGTEELYFKMKKKSGLLSFLFGIEGELAGNALRAQKKALRTSSLSLTCSFLSFTVILCFLTLSGISTKHTYFERYQDMWDIMVTVKDVGLEETEWGEEIRELPEVRSSVIYQKAEAVCMVPESMISEELRMLGGLEHVAGTVNKAENTTASAETVYLVNAPVIIMDDSGFAEYCKQIGVEPAYDGSIVINRIWDSISSTFRYRKYIPFVKEDRQTLILQQAGRSGEAADRTVSGDMGESMAEISVLAYTDILPVLREEYEQYALVQIIPFSLRQQISGQILQAEPDSYIRILGEEEAGLSELDQLQAEISEIIPQTVTAEAENRIQEKKTDEAMRTGYMVFTGAFCVLLAVIGAASVFSNTLGFLYHRKREFSRYLSIGMTPAGMRKLFLAESLVIAGKPLLITLPLTALITAFMIQASDLDPMEFIAEAPWIPILLFALGIMGVVGLAYYLGGRKLLSSNLTEALRNESIY